MARRHEAQAIVFRAVAVDEGDGAALAAAMAAEIAELYDGLDHNGPSMPKAGPVELGPPDGGFWVGYVHHERACCGGLKRLPDESDGSRIVEIKKMYVVPAWRRHGIARYLLGFLEGEARRRRYAVVRLDTGPRQGIANASTVLPATATSATSMRIRWQPSSARSASSSDGNVHLVARITAAGGRGRRLAEGLGGWVT